LTQCKMLRAIHCYNTPLTSLDLSNLKNIYEIYCYDCNLNTLNVSGCTGLEKLLCNNNQLASLDVSGASNLSELDCKINDLKSIKLNKKIETLFLDNNADLKSVDLTGCSRLRVLVTVGTGITNINISSCPKLEAAYSKGPINPEGNEYSTVVNAEEYRISCNLGTNIITKNDPTDKVVDINETNFPDQFLRQRLSTYDLDGDGALNALELRSITKLDLNYNYKDLTGIGYLTYLEELYISNCENLKEVDLSKNVNLENLICFYNPDLSKLALPDSGRIISVQCNDNALKSLDLSKCTGLEALECSNNPISKLDVSKNINLETLICRSNNLTVLDISNNEKLAYLACFGNNIENLDISDNPKLVTAIMNGEKQTELSQGIEFLSYMDMDNECGIFIDAKTVVVSSKPTATPTATPTPAATATPASAPVTTAVPTKADPVSLTLNKKTAKVTCGKTLTLKATLTGSSDKITWKSSNTKIATVDASGKIKAKMAGEVTITATAAGKTAKCVVTVLYKDVTNTKDFWYAPTNYLTAKGVVKGYDKQTKFKPANDCTRAQMVTFLYRLQGEPKIKSTTCKFKDVKKTDYFFKPVIWAVEKGITTGVSKTKFKPKGVCTRAQTVTFLWRMAGKPDPKTKKNPFPDVKKKDYFYKATLWASEKKILAGMPDGTFNPQGKCLRRQMVTFLYKYDKFVNGKG
ncbi:MAG: S-layer homology domain-containing protein, partial [Lachnospiraceae bacterium]|nr:S-layer homology domain-containing protein [Lachnospiraceae bacterium]